MVTGLLCFHRYGCILNSNTFEPSRICQPSAGLRVNPAHGAAGRVRDVGEGRVAARQPDEMLARGPAAPHPCCFAVISTALRRG
jgi:hypothetical protein